MRVFRAGFSGTRRGMTAEQSATLRKVLRRLRTGCEVDFHHGDCVGADEQSHRIAGELGCKRIVHPPTNNALRAFCKGEETRGPKEYHARNRDIVEEGDDLLIACPFSATDETGGTWHAIHHARAKKVKINVINPDGTLTVEEFDEPERSELEE